MLLPPFKAKQVTELKFSLMGLLLIFFNSVPQRTPLNSLKNLHVGKGNGLGSYRSSQNLTSHQIS